MQFAELNDWCLSTGWVHVQCWQDKKQLPPEFRPIPHAEHVDPLLFLTNGDDEADQSQREGEGGAALTLLEENDDERPTNSAEHQTRWI